MHNVIFILCYYNGGIGFFITFLIGLWIGATDRNLDGAFNWESDGSVVSTDVLEWDDRGGYPVGQECLVMYLLNANKKRDYACSVLQGYICERRT